MPFFWMLDLCGFHVFVISRILTLQCIILFIFVLIYQQIAEEAMILLIQRYPLMSVQSYKYTEVSKGFTC